MLVPALANRLQARIAERASADGLRERLIRDGVPMCCQLHGNAIINFASNDYLGLAGDPQVRAAFCRGVERYGVGSGASEMVSGHTDAHEELEIALADFTQRERALVFSTGYMANLAVLSVLAERGHEVYEDRLNHASLIDAAVLARARVVRYAHADAGALDQRLRETAASTPLVVTDGVFSMDGDIAPLPQLAKLCRDRDGVLIVDDAHGFGVIGEAGGGTVELFSLSAVEVPVLIGTFGKALGAAGAFVAGGRLLIEALEQFARPYVYTTALPPAIACAVRAGLQLIATEPERRQRLHSNIQYFRERATLAGIPLRRSQTAIQPILIGDSGRAAALGAALRAHGFWVAAIRPPSVPKGTARLRVALSAGHTAEDIDGLIHALAAEI